MLLAVKNGEGTNLGWELADLFSHLAAVMAVHGISAGEVNDELARRSGGGGR